jgi:putative hemolysin
MLLEIIALLLCLLLSAFFSASEVAFFSISKSKLQKIVDEKPRNYDALVKLKNDTDKFIITVLVGNNLANISATVLATHLFLSSFGNNGLFAATAVMTLAVLIFGEILPKEYASDNAQALMLHTATYFLALSNLLFPIIFIFEHLTRTILVIIGVRKIKQKNNVVNTPPLKHGKHHAVKFKKVKRK